MVDEMDTPSHQPQLPWALSLRFPLVGEDIGPLRSVNVAEPSGPQDHFLPLQPPSLDKAQSSHF